MNNFDEFIEIIFHLEMSPIGVFLVGIGLVILILLFLPIFLGLLWLFLPFVILLFIIGIVIFFLSHRHGKEVESSSS